MEIIDGLDSLKKPFQHAVVTLGNFDGVHLGHQRIFQRVKEEAERFHGESVVITFDPHPLKILSPGRCPPLLTPFKKKMVLIEKTGIETVLCVRFTKAFAEIPPFEFIRLILAEKVRARKVIVGYNYHFGKAKGGDVRYLKDTCRRFSIEVEVVEALKIGEMPVSSSKIRELIREGAVDVASMLLGRDYLIIGKVIEGKKRGHVLGFPTANLEITDELYPKVGVYAVEVFRGGRSFNGVANVGMNPTFADGRLSFEIFILDFDQDIYGEEIQVSFRKRIRDEVAFDSPARLIEQIRKDIEWAQDKVFGAS